MAELEIRAVGPDDPRTALLAFAGCRTAGRLEGLFLSSALYFIRELTCSDGFPCTVVEDALARFLRDSFLRDGVSILSSERPESAEINAALERSGFVVEKRKALVTRSLKSELPKPEVEFVFRSLAETGRDTFLRVMTAAAEGDPFEDMEHRDPDADFDELVDAAGQAFDATSWMLASVDGRVVGAVLPQVFPDREAEGTLFYVAVLPPFRGRGLGRALHAAGLALLAGRGVTRYLGSTDTRNEPMLRIFSANGCTRSGTQLFYGPAAR